MSPRLPRARAAIALACTLAACVGIALERTQVLESLEQRSIGTRFELRQPPTPTEIVVVGIDDVSFAALGLQWPFPRSLHGRAIDRLHAAGATTIVYDVQFTEPTSRREDDALIRAIDRAGGAVMATSEVDDAGATAILGGDDVLRRIGAEPGSTAFPHDRAGGKSRFEHSSAGLRTLGVVAAARATGRALPPEAFPAGGALIDFRGGPGTFRTISFSDVVQGRLEPGAVEGRIVVVGALAPSLQDFHATPASETPMAGPEVVANAIWTALHDLPLRDAPAPLAPVLILLLAFAPALAARRLRVLPASLAMLAVGAAYALAVKLAFDAGVVVPAAVPLVTLAVASVAAIVASHVTESRERMRIALENELLERRVRERTAELEQSQLEIVRRLGQAAESRDEETGQHIDRISRRCEALGRALGMDDREAELLRHASAMHDVGKIGIPDAILLKPAKLEPDEWEIMKSHTTIGAAMLSGSPSPVLQMAEQIALSHHERWDGGGYPEGLLGEQIPLPARICAICDVYDALVSERPYKSPWTREQAMEEIGKQRGKHFDPAIVGPFLALLAEDEDTAAPAVGDHWDANVAAFAERPG